MNIGSTFMQPDIVVTFFACAHVYPWNPYCGLGPQPTTFVLAAPSRDQKILLMKVEVAR